MIPDSTTVTKSPNVPSIPTRSGVVPELGNTTESASPPYTVSRIIWRYRMQAESRRLLNNWRYHSGIGKPHRISCCMRYLAYGVDRVTVQKHERKTKARFKGLMKCDSVWVCPVCSSVITERRKEELHQAVNNAKLKGLDIFMVTYTLRHNHGDDLILTLNTLLNAYRYSRSGATGLRIRKKYSIVGSIKALEVTHGKNGWHPHLHELMFVSGDIVTQHTRIDLENTLRDRWMHMVEKFGGTVERDIGLDVQKGDAFVAEYVAKFGHEPKEEKWSLQAEMAKTSVKVARSKDGRTPFALLEDSAAGDKAAGKLFVDYAAAFKGRAQLMWSPGLSALLGVDVMTEQDANEEAEPDMWFTLSLLERDDWDVIKRAEKRGELLEIAAKGDILALKDFVLTLHMGEVEF